MDLSEAGVLVGHFIACFIGLGTIYTFGLWIPAVLDEFKGSHAQVQVIMSLLQTGFYLGSIPARKLLQHIGFRATYLIGGMLAIATLVAISFAQQLWMTYIVLLAGVGFQSAWFVSGALIPRHLPKQKATKYQAFVVTGSGLGTMAWAGISKLLLPKFGWRGGLRIIALIQALLYAIGALGQQAPPPLSKQDTEDSEGGYRRILGNCNFSMFLISIGLCGFGYMLPSAVQGAHATKLGLSIEEIASIYTFFGCFSIAGRLLAGLIGSRMHPVLVFALAMYGIGGSVALIGISTNFGMLASANALLGITSGPMIALLVPACRALVGLGSVPDAIAMVMFIQAFGVLPAPTLAGWLADNLGSYREGILIGAGGACIAAVISSFVAWRQIRHEDIFTKDSDSTLQEGGNQNLEGNHATGPEPAPQSQCGEDRC